MEFFQIYRQLLVLRIFAFALSFIYLVHAYEQPVAHLDVLDPVGFEVSIPHEEGISSVDFECKVSYLEWTVRPRSPENGRWRFRVRNVKLELGDKVYFLLFVVHKGRTYALKGVFLIEIENADAIGLREVSTTPTPQSLFEDQWCPTSKTTVNGITQRCPGQIVFEDEFLGFQLNTNKWKIEHRFADEPDNEFVWYLNNIPEVLRVINGAVIIKPIAANIKFPDPFQHSHNLGPKCTGQLETSECVRQGGKTWDVPPFISAQFSTKGRFAFKYGRIEIRAKLPNAPWVFPEIWLQPVGSAYGVSDYQLGQMRVAFSRCNGNATDLFGGIILHKDEPLRSVKMCKMTSSQNANWGDGFHVYKLKWTEHYIAVAVDNVEYCYISPTSEADALYNINLNGNILPNRNKLSESSSLLAPFDQEFFITLGYGIGGHTDFADEKSWQEVKPWHNSDPKAMKKLWNQKEQSMQQWLANGDFIIDYVKVYAV